MKTIRLPTVALSAAVRRALPATLVLGASMLAAPAAQAVQCFSMYDPNNQLLYQASRSPIDLSQPISQEMAAHFPRRYLVISFGAECPESGTLSDRTITLTDASFRQNDATSVSQIRRTRRTR